MNDIPILKFQWAHKFLYLDQTRQRRLLESLCDPDCNTYKVHEEFPEFAKLQISVMRDNLGDICILFFRYAMGEKFCQDADEEPKVISFKSAG